jgi:tetratricopeptide (TPR) repeat protein
MLVEKAIEYLDRLSREAAGDPSLQREVVQGYLKMGTIQGNMYSANVGEPAQAAASYRRAQEMAESLVRVNPGNIEDEQLLAAASMNLGDLVAIGDSKEALRHYRRALDILERQGAATATAERRILQLAAKIAFVQLRTGDLAGSLASYRRSLELAEKWLAVEPGNEVAHKAVAVASTRAGEILSRIGKREEGLERLRYGLSAYQQLMKAHPESAAARRDVAATLIILGDVHSGARALAVLKPLVEGASPSGYDIQQYVWLLVTSPFEDLRNPALALPYARRAVEMTKGSHPGTLDALARAYFGVGDSANAVATEEKALSLLPPLKPGEQVSSLRKELEENLARFRAHRSH